MLFAGPPVAAEEPPGALDSTPPRVAVAPIGFEGTVNRAREAGLREALVRGLVQGELDVVGPAEVAEHHDASRCPEGACAKAVAAAVGARYMVTTHVTYRDRTYAFALDAYDARTGDLVASSSDRCSLCGSTEARDLLSKQAAGLRAKLERLSVGPARLEIITSPAGARVRVDGELRGESPLSLNLPPGTHRVELVAEGHAPIVRSVDAVRGVRETLSETLAPTPSVVPSDAPTRRTRTARTMKVGGAVSLGLGAGALATGVALLVLDGSPREGRCTGSDVDASGNCRQVYTSLPHGIALTAAGAGLLGAGVGLLIAGARRGRARPPTQARIQLLGGTVRGWF